MRPNTSTHKQWILISILLIVLILDFLYSFIQYYNTPLFGDMQSGILPDKFVQSVFDDPLGFEKIVTGEKGVNPNRFFSHYLFSKYFLRVPLWLQQLVNPIPSVYLSCAIIKIVVQIVFVFLLASFISGKKKPFRKDFLIASVLIAPLFQVYGYNSRMGIIDKSIAYSFFYAIPIVVLMLFLFPIFNSIVNNKRYKKPYYLFLLPLTIILPLSGPLIPAVIIITTFLILIYYMGQSKTISCLKDIPKIVYVLLIPASLWSLYSLGLGFYDSNYQAETIPLLARFYKLPEGIYSQLFHSFGFPLMLITIAVNIYLIRKINLVESQRFIKILKWGGIFALIYIVLLPFGGYRPYRPLIIRYDTFMPITIILMYFIGATTYFIINRLKGKRKIRYLVVIISILAIFAFSDTGGIGKNSCEKQALQKMAISSDSIVSIPNNCYIMGWDNIRDYKDSEKRAELIKYWRITDTKKLFFNEE